MTICAILMVATQIIFVVNFFYSMFFGPPAGRNPWHRNTLEWPAPSPPGHGNFDFQPVVYRGPYEYGSPEVEHRLLSANAAAAAEPTGSGARALETTTARRARRIENWFVENRILRRDRRVVVVRFRQRCFHGPSDQSVRSPWPHRWAVALACATFPLVWVGGLVTTTDAGMAVPDWPNTYGYNLFLYPWQSWLAGPWDLFVEHGHRMLAATVGLITIGMLVVFMRLERRNWVRGMGFAALGLVIFQGRWAACGCSSMSEHSRCSTA